MKLQFRKFGDADDVREVPFGRLETYDMGEMRIGPRRSASPIAGFTS